MCKYLFTSLLSLPLGISLGAEVLRGDSFQLSSAYRMGSLLFFPWRQNKWDVLNGAESPCVARCLLSTFLRHRGLQVEAGRGRLTLPGRARACLCSQLEGGEEGTRSPLGCSLTHKRGLGGSCPPSPPPGRVRRH